MTLASESHLMVCDHLRPYIDARNIESVVGVLFVLRVIEKEKEQRERIGEKMGFRFLTPRSKRGSMTPLIHYGILEECSTYPVQVGPNELTMS